MTSNGEDGSIFLIRVFGAKIQKKLLMTRRTGYKKTKDSVYVLVADEKIHASSRMHSMHLRRYMTFLRMCQVQNLII